MANLPALVIHNKEQKVVSKCYSIMLVDIGM